MSATRERPLSAPGSGSCWCPAGTGTRQPPEVLSVPDILDEDQCHAEHPLGHGRCQLPDHHEGPHKLDAYQEEWKLHISEIWDNRP